MDLGLENKRALVTGASEGIGRAVVDLLADEGCDVAFCARRQELLDVVAAQATARTGRRLVPLQTDMADRDAVEAFVGNAAKALGGIDILVNSAGTSMFGSFDEVPDERWLVDIELKLMGYVRATRAALPHLRNSTNGGRVIRIGGNGGRQPFSYHLPGGAVNAALLNLTVSLASWLAEDGIHVIACAPGPVRTARFARQIAANARSWKVDVGEAERRFVADLPLGRVPSAEEIAQTIVFLASPRAANITGTCVTVDGGITRGI